MIPRGTRVLVQKDPIEGLGTVIGEQSGYVFVRLDGPTSLLLLCGPDEVFFRDTEF